MLQLPVGMEAGLGEGVERHRSLDKKPVLGIAIES